MSISDIVFWKKVNRRAADECWPWKAGCLTSGYGAFRWQGRQIGAHRMAYILTHGEVPPGLFVLHRCDNPPCCNPAHLYAGTQAQNMRDKKERGRAASGDRNGARLHPETHVRGAKHPRAGARLTPEAVLAIRAAHAAGGESQASLSRRFGVTQGQISHIVNRRQWTHL